MRVPVVSAFRASVSDPQGKVFRPLGRKLLATAAKIKSEILQSIADFVV